MTTLDLRPVQRDAHRDRVFETLDGLAVGDSVTLLVDGDVDVLLHQYQMKRGNRLQWQSEPRDGETRAHQVTKGESFDDAELVEFDVREMPPQRRHEVLTDTFDRLDAGEGFVLVNDHDPKPLYYELRSTRGETFDWEYTNRDPQEWRVELVKTDATESADDGVVAAFDVRQIPKQERHPTIHHRFGNVAPGETIEIVAPHEPRPLHREFQHRYGESFTWDVVEAEPGRCRVRITKTDGATGEGSNDGPERTTSDASPDVVRELDVRELPPARRHELIYDAYDALDAGEGFVLVNDHDPKPLYHQFDAEAGDEFYWEYRRRDPGEFRVLVGKTDSASTESPNGHPDAPF